jgi:hypothetical protein
MYRKTDPQQCLFGVQTQLSKSLQSRLQGSWANLFRAEILPILLKSEDNFASLYGKTGRPNFSVARMLGLCLLQELNNLSDQQALDSFGFDIRWRFALDAGDDDAYISRRSLVEFRRRLVACDPKMTLVRSVFHTISKAAIKKLGLSATDQRVDSTLVVSNICNRGRLDLFIKTIDHFIKSLDKAGFSRIPKYIQKWHKQQPDALFGAGPVERKQTLRQLAKYLNRLIMIFKNDPHVSDSEPYQLMVRLFKEQCMVQDPSGSSTGKRNGKQIKVKNKTEGEQLQSPYDPDASYGHKGNGYSAHITETCNNKKSCEIITDYEVHGAARSDVGKAVDVVNRLASADLKPNRLFADGGYPSVPSSLDIVGHDIKFMAPVNRPRISDQSIGRELFTFDKNGCVLRCPQRHRPVAHRMRSCNNKKGKALHAIFNGDICRACGKLEQCPVRAPNNRARGCNVRNTTGDFRLEVTAQLRLRDQMYADQQSNEWKQQYKIRAGIEATMSELKRSHGMGKLRVRRAPKVCFAVACKVIACNIKRWARVAENSGGSLLYICCRILALLSLEEVFKERLKLIFTDSKLIYYKAIWSSETGY